MKQKMMGIVLVFLSAIGLSHEQDKVEAKKLYIPAKVWLVPEHNNYDSKESDYSYSRMMETDNIAMFWHKEYGDNIMVKKYI